MSGPNSLPQDLKFLHDTFRNNGYSSRFSEPHHLTERILLQWHSYPSSAQPLTASVGCSPTLEALQYSLAHQGWPGLKNASCIQHYPRVWEVVHQTERSIETGKRTPTHLCLPSWEICGGEHSINLGHHIQLHSTNILAKKLRGMDWIIREAT
jgi:hypothetical protein